MRRPRLLGSGLSVDTSGLSRLLFGLRSWRGDDGGERNRGIVHLRFQYRTE